jgi:transposase InsO family protein
VGSTPAGVRVGAAGHRVARSTVYRVLVRNHLIEPRSRRRRREDYVRWERAAAMQLWQLDVTASLFLADGSELKIVTGIDDHSRFCVLAAVVRRATARAVCAAFIAAMTAYGIPEEVLTDNGKVFTGRFTRPVGVEVLFGRICRENGIVARLTKPRSPTTTGKIERLHQSLQVELLDLHGPFATVEAAQAAIDVWRDDYNRDRPHQALNMAFPASRFGPVHPATGSELRLPAELAAAAASSSPGGDDDNDDDQAVLDEGPVIDDALAARERIWRPAAAVEVKRVVPASGNLCLAGQQIWLGPALAGRVVTIWVDQTSLHVSLDTVRLKTLPSRLSSTDLARLTAADGQPAGPAPLPEADRHGGVDVERTVNAVGLISLAGRSYNVGFPLAGQRVTLRLNGNVMAVLAGHTLLRTLACPIPAEDRPRLRGARPSPRQPLVVTERITVQRRVSTGGAIHIVNQQIQVGKAHAGKTVTVTVDADRFTVAIDTDLILEVARTNNQPVRRYKINASEATPRTYHRTTTHG